LLARNQITTYSTMRNMVEIKVVPVNHPNGEVDTIVDDANVKSPG